MSSVYCLLEKSVMGSFLRTRLLNGQFLSNACMEMNQLRRSWIRCLCKQTSCISLMMDRFFHVGFPNHEMVSSEEITNYPLGCTNHDVYILDCIVIALASWCQWCMRYSMMETSVRFLTPKQKWQDVAMERGVFTFSSIIASIYIYLEYI